MSSISLQESIIMPKQAYENLKKQTCMMPEKKNNDCTAKCTCRKDIQNINHRISVLEKNIKSNVLKNKSKIPIKKKVLKKKSKISIQKKDLKKESKIPIKKKTLKSKPKPKPKQKLKSKSKPTSENKNKSKKKDISSPMDIDSVIVQKKQKSKSSNERSMDIDPLFSKRKLPIDISDRNFKKLKKNNKGPIKSYLKNKAKIKENKLKQIKIKNNLMKQTITLKRKLPLNNIETSKKQKINTLGPIKSYVNKKNKLKENKLKQMKFKNNLIKQSEADFIVNRAMTENSKHDNKREKKSEKLQLLKNPNVSKNMKTKNKIPKTLIKIIKNKGQQGLSKILKQDVIRTNHVNSNTDNLSIGWEILKSQYEPKPNLPLPPLFSNYENQNQNQNVRRKMKRTFEEANLETGGYKNLLNPSRFQRIKAAASKRKKAAEYESDDD